MTTLPAPVKTASPGDAELIALAQRGNEEAIGTLYNQHSQAVFRYFQARLSDEGTAEDLTGEVFCQMLTGLPQFRFFGLPFRAWLFRIAHNLLVDYFRKQSRQLAAHPASLPQQPGEDVCDQVTERKLTLAAARRALAEIDPLQQEVLTLRFLSGLSVRDTALALRKSEDAVKALQRRGLLTLRLSLCDES